MICPIDQVQMHQLDKIGGGVSEEDLYLTWELKICPLCGRVVKESYECEVLDQEGIEYFRKWSGEENETRTTS